MAVRDTAEDDGTPGAAARLPAALLAVRHGESTANAEFAAAEAAGATEVSIHYRDADVPLSERGRRQAAALGRWLGGLPGPSGRRASGAPPTTGPRRPPATALAAAARSGLAPLPYASTTGCGTANSAYWRCSPRRP